MAVATHKLRRRFLQYGIRSLLALMLVCALFMAWLRYKRQIYEDQRKALDEIARLGGEYKTIAKEPAWMRWLIGEDYVDATEINFKSESTGGKLPLTFPVEIGTDDLKCLRQIPTLKAFTVGVTREKLNDGLLDQLESATRLERFDVTSTDISDRGVRKLAQLPYLKSVSLRNCKNTLASLLALSAHPYLETLYFDWDDEANSFTPRIEVTGFRSLAQLTIGDRYWTFGGPSTDHLTVTDMPKLDSLTALLIVYKSVELRRLPSLKALNLDQCGEKLILEDIPNLEAISWKSALEVQLKNVGSLKKIKAINSCITGLPGSTLQSLESLELMNCELAALPEGNWQHLHTLSISGSATNPGHLQALLRAPNLRSLAVGDLCTTELAGVRNCPDLEVLTIRDTSTSDEELDAIAALPKLNEVTLSRVSGVRGEFLRHLEKCPSLKKIWLLDTPELDDSAIPHLLKLPANVAVWLNVEESKISERGKALLGERQNISL